MRFRRRLSYANVVSSLALFLALTGGLAWAAHKITSNEIGKGAVKNKNLAKNAVTSGKIKKGAVNFAKIAAGTNVIASATAGPLSADQEGPVNLLSSPLVVTPKAGQPITVEVEARGTLSGEDCNAIIFPTVNGSHRLLIGELLQLHAPEPGNPLFSGGFPVADVAFPVGLTEPGKPQSIQLELLGNQAKCNSNSTLDQVAIVAMQAK